VRGVPKLTVVRLYMFQQMRIQAMDVRDASDGKCMYWHEAI
jgi:hypothetical protein